MGFLDETYGLRGKTAVVTGARSGLGQASADPEDIGAAVAFLAAPAARYIHGHVLVVDGGWMGR